MASLINSMEILGSHILAAPLAAGTALFTLMVAFSYIIFHQITYKEEKGYLSNQMLNNQMLNKQIAAELESVESSQERRSKKEREEEQSIEDLDSDSDSEERPTKRPRLVESTVAEVVLQQLEQYNERVHLITFAATDSEADYILKYVPMARYLVNLNAKETHDHITEVRYARMRCNSAPAEIIA